MYPEYLQLSLEKVAEKREANTALQPERMTAEEKDVLPRPSWARAASMLAM